MDLVLYTKPLEYSKEEKVFHLHVNIWEKSEDRDIYLGGLKIYIKENKQIHIDNSLLDREKFPKIKRSKEIKNLKENLLIFTDEIKKLNNINIYEVKEKDYKSGYHDGELQHIIIYSMGKEAFDYYLSMIIPFDYYFKITYGKLEFDFGSYIEESVKNKIKAYFFTKSKYRVKLLFEK